MAFRWIPWLKLAWNLLYPYRTLRKCHLYVRKVRPSRYRPTLARVWSSWSGLECSWDWTRSNNDVWSWLETISCRCSRTLNPSLKLCISYRAAIQEFPKATFLDCQCWCDFRCITRSPLKLKHMLSWSSEPTLLNLSLILFGWFCFDSNTIKRLRQCSTGISKVIRLTKFDAVDNLYPRAAKLGPNVHAWRIPLWS